MWHGSVQAGLTAQEGRSDRVVHMVSRRSEAEDTRRDRIACVEAKRGVVPGCPSDEENFKFPILPSRGVYRLKGIVVICHLSGTRYILEMGGRWQPSCCAIFSFFPFPFSIGLA